MDFLSLLSDGGDAPARFVYPPRQIVRRTHYSTGTSSSSDTESDGEEEEEDAVPQVLSHYATQRRFKPPGRREPQQRQHSAAAVVQGAAFGGRQRVTSLSLLPPTHLRPTNLFHARDLRILEQRMGTPRGREETGMKKGDMGTRREELRLVPRLPVLPPPVRILHTVSLTYGVKEHSSDTTEEEGEDEEEEEEAQLVLKRAKGPPARYAVHREADVLHWATGAKRMPLGTSDLHDDDEPTAEEEVQQGRMHYAGVLLAAVRLAMVAVAQCREEEAQKVQYPCAEEWDV